MKENYSSELNKNLMTHEKHYDARIHTIYFVLFE